MGHGAMGVILVYSRTNMYICVPVLILCRIIGLIWVLSSYISSAMGVILVYIQCDGCYPRIYPDKYVHMRARIDTVSYNRFDMGDILVYTQCACGYIQGEHLWRGYIPGEKAVSIR